MSLVSFYFFPRLLTAGVFATRVPAQRRSTGRRPRSRRTRQSPTGRRQGARVGRAPGLLRAQRRGELKERGREGALGSDSQEAGPARNPCADGRRPQLPRDRSGPMARKKAQELHGLATKPAADLNPDVDKTAAPRAFELRVRSVPLEAVSDDLNAPLIRDVHVGKSHMAGDPGAGFATDSRDGMLKGQRSRCDDAGGAQAERPRVRRCVCARAAAAAQGRTRSPWRAPSSRAAAARARAWITGRVSHHEAQCAAKRSEVAERRPRPPNRWARWC